MRKQLRVCVAFVRSLCRACALALAMLASYSSCCQFVLVGVRFAAVHEVFAAVHEVFAAVHELFAAVHEVYIANMPTFVLVGVRFAAMHEVCTLPTCMTALD